MLDYIFLARQLTSLPIIPVMKHGSVFYHNSGQPGRVKKKTVRKCLHLVCLTILQLLHGINA